MMCPLCNQRKAKRFCPAKATQICAVCCGTKRIVEIPCPADCPYLATARHHPPAVVQRRADSDRAMLLPLLQGFSERQARLFLLLASVVSRHQPEGFQKLFDADVAQAAEALAATIETAGRGIVYERQPASLVAARLMGELKAMIDDVTRNAAEELGVGVMAGVERDAATGLRRLEEAAKSVAVREPDSRRFQELLARVLAPAPGTVIDGEKPPTTRPSSLIIPS
jgi:hypothetical protein